MKKRAVYWIPYLTYLKSNKSICIEISYRAYAILGPKVVAQASDKLTSIQWLLNEDKGGLLDPTGRFAGSPILPSLKINKSNVIYLYMYRTFILTLIGAKVQVCIFGPNGCY